MTLNEIFYMQKHLLYVIFFYFAYSNPELGRGGMCVCWLGRVDGKGIQVLYVY